MTRKIVLGVSTVAMSVALSVALAAPLLAQAQNVAVVNGKSVPKARVDALMAQAVKQNQPKTPELETQVRDEVVLREMFMQEAEKRGVAGTAEYKTQMELARQTILIRELFGDFQKKNPVTDDEVKAEYEKLKGQSAGTEYRARHILVEKEEEAKALIAQIKGGAKFEDLAKKSSKDTGSAENGGDLDWAKPTAYVPEFSAALQGLKKGQMTETPIKTQFGYHIIRLEDTRTAQFPAFDEVKDKVKQQMQQVKLQEYEEKLRKAAKTDYKFAAEQAQQAPAAASAPAQK